MNTRSRCCIHLLLLCLIAMPLGACYRPVAQAPEDAAAPYEPLAVALLRDERFQPEVKMLAVAQGETVAVQIQNMTDKPLGVGPENFGIIRQGEGKAIHPFDSSLHSAAFPLIGLRKGEITSGSLTFTGLGNLAGQRLVFSHSQTQPSVAYITGEGAEAIAVPKPPATAPAP